MVLRCNTLVLNTRKSRWCQILGLDFWVNTRTCRWDMCMSGIQTLSCRLLPRAISARPVSMLVMPACVCCFSCLIFGIFALFSCFCCQCGFMCFFCLCWFFGSFCFLCFVLFYDVGVFLFSFVKWCGTCTAILKTVFFAVPGWNSTSPLSKRTALGIIFVYIYFFIYTFYFTHDVDMFAFFSQWLTCLWIPYTVYPTKCDA